MNIIFDEASKDDIKELVRLRIAYMIDDFGGVVIMKENVWRSSCRIILTEN